MVAYTWFVSPIQIPPEVAVRLQIHMKLALARQR